MIFIAASGQGSRIRPYLAEMGIDDTPKHLLDIYHGHPDREETLLRRNTLSALKSGSAVTVLANSENIERISGNLKDLECEVIIDLKDSPLGVFAFTKQDTQGSTVYSIAGDAYIDDAPWAKFRSFHENSTKPVTFLVGESEAKKDGAVFNVDTSTSQISAFYRSETDGGIVTRNIGMYAIDLVQPVTDIIEYYQHAEGSAHDEICAELVTQGFVQAMSHQGVFFNINTINDYRDLLAYVSRNETAV